MMSRTESQSIFLKSVSMENLDLSFYPPPPNLPPPFLLPSFLLFFLGVLFLPSFRLTIAEDNRDNQKQMEHLPAWEHEVERNESLGRNISAKEKFLLLLH